MITVSILINNEPIYTRSARRQETEKGDNTYVTDAGVEIKHKYNDGVIPLAKKILDTIREDY